MIRLFITLLFSLAVHAQETTTTTAEETTTTTTTIEETTTTSTTSTSTTSTTLWPKTVTLAWDAPTVAGVGGINIYEVIDGEYVLKGNVAVGVTEFIFVDVSPGKHCYIVANVYYETLVYSNRACFYQDRGRAHLKFRPRVIP